MHTTYLYMHFHLQKCGLAEISQAVQHHPQAVHGQDDNGSLPGKQSAFFFLDSLFPLVALVAFLTV